MPGRAAVLPLLLLLPLAAGCEPDRPPPEPGTTSTVTVTATPPPVAEPSTGPSPVDDGPLVGVRTVHGAWATLDVQCKNGTSGVAVDAACDARDEVGRALERTAIAAYVRAWHARDGQTLSELTPPDQQDAVQLVLEQPLPEGEEPACVQFDAEGETAPAREECTVAPVQEEPPEGAVGWVMRLDPTWGDERLAPEIYVVPEQIDYG